MKNLSNLFPDTKWTPMELELESQEVERELKKLFKAVGLYIHCEGVKDDKWMLFRRGQLELPSILDVEWRVKQYEKNNRTEKELKYIKSYANFRNRNLTKNMERKRKLDDLLLRLNGNKDLIKRMKEIFDMYKSPVPEIAHVTRKDKINKMLLEALKSKTPINENDAKKEAEKQLREEESREKQLYFENAMKSAFFLCMNINYSVPIGRTALHIDDRSKRVKKCLSYSISKAGKSYSWSDYAECAKREMDELHVSLTEAHMAEEMRLNGGYQNCLKQTILTT